MAVLGFPAYCEYCQNIGLNSPFQERSLIFFGLSPQVFGTMLGRHLKRRASFPCRVHSIPRQIPKSPWYVCLVLYPRAELPSFSARSICCSFMNYFRYSSPLFTIPTAGILPFTSIFAELYFTYSSVWRYKVRSH